MARSGGISQQLTLDGATEVKQAFREIGQSGAQAFGQVDKTSRTAAQSLRGFTRELTGVQRGSVRLIRSFSDMGRSVEIVSGLLGSMAGGVAGGFLGVAAARGISSLLGSLDTLSAKLTTLQKQAREAGVDPLALQAAGRQAMLAGQDAEVGQKGFANFASAVEKAKAAADKEDTGGVNVLRGNAAREAAGNLNNLVTVIKGGTQAVIDFNDPLKALQVNLKDIKTPADQVKAYEEAVKRALVLGQQFPMQINRLSQDLFGMPLATLREVAADGQKFDALIKQLAASQAGATQQALDDNKRLIQAQNQLSIAFEEAFAGYNRGLLRVQIDTNLWLAKFISEILPKWGADVEAWFANFIPQITADFTAGWQTMLDNFRANGMASLANALTDWSSFFNSIKGMASSALSAIGSVLSRMGAASPAVMPGFAGGGLVNGPGSATSDSIMARLSAGEFVMRAAAVDHWGAGLLASMNAVAGGLSAPLVQRSGRRGFADGGLVTAGAGGTPVHLHLGGKSFALSGAGSVVDSLVAEAHSQQMRSAGVKPSWYGSRPSGR